MNLKSLAKDTGVLQTVESDPAQDRDSIGDLDPTEGTLNSPVDTQIAQQKTQPPPLSLNTADGSNDAIPATHKPSNLFDTVPVLMKYYTAKVDIIENVLYSMTPKYSRKFMESFMDSMFHHSPIDRTNPTALLYYIGGIK